MQSESVRVQNCYNGRNPLPEFWYTSKIVSVLLLIEINNNIVAREALKADEMPVD